MVENEAKRIPCKRLDCENNLNFIKFCMFPTSKKIIDKAKKDENSVCPIILEFLKSNNLI